MSEVNPLTQPGACGSDQSTRHAPEHGGSYAHNPAPHLSPAPVISPDHLEHLAAVAVETDSQAETVTVAETEIETE
jgi:hypothetical protein